MQARKDTEAVRRQSSRHCKRPGSRPCRHSAALPRSRALPALTVHQTRPSEQSRAGRALRRQADERRILLCIPNRSANRCTLRGDQCGRLQIPVAGLKPIVWFIARPPISGQFHKRLSPVRQCRNDGRDDHHRFWMGNRYGCLAGLGHLL